MVNVRAGLNRHLNSPPHNLAINIMKNPDFQGANQVLAGVFRTMRMQGKDNPKHKTAVPAKDFDIAYRNGTLSEDNPVSLQHKVYVEVTVHCARRGCEGLRELKKDSFTKKSDENDREYITLSYRELEKQRQGLDIHEVERDCRMYAQPEDPLCPVKSFDLYLSKLHPKCEAFFQRPNANYARNNVWYVNSPVGKNMINEFMKTISVKGKMSQVYTNHCLRATAATILSRANFSPLEICSVTGHKNIDSLKSYVQGSSDQCRYDMSRALHNHGKGSNDSSSASAPQPSTSVAPVSVNSNPPQSESTNQSENAMLPATENSLSMSSSSTNFNLERLTHSLFSGVTFESNSNPTFNISFNSK